MPPAGTIAMRIEWHRDKSDCEAADAKAHAADRPSPVDATPGTPTDAPDFPLPDDHGRPAPQPAVPTPEERRYAGFPRRVVAFVIDGVVLSAFALPLVFAGFVGVKLALVVLRLPAPVDTMDALESLASIGWLMMATIYFTALHTGNGQTIGKALVGIRVRRMADLAPLGVLRSALRALGYFASSSFFGVGFLLVALTPSNRGWHDYLAGTCVVRLAPDEA